MNSGKKTPSSLPRFHSLGALAVIAFLFGVCGAQFAPQMSSKETRKIKAEISTLPLSQRNAIERNLDEYQKLPEAEQMRYWEMHQEIEELQLSQMVKEYESWLRTLSPFGAQALRGTTEPAQKVAEVEKILIEQRKRDERNLPELIARIIERKIEDLEGKSSQHDSSYWVLRFFFTSRSELDFKDHFVLTKSELERYINEVMYSQLRASEQEKIDNEKKEGMDRMIRIIQASLSLTNDSRRNWPSKALFDAMEADGMSLTLNKPKNERYFMGRVVPEQMIPNLNELRKRFAFRMLLIRSLMVYEIQEFERKNPVQDNELLQFFKLSDSSKQHALLNSPAQYQAEALKWLYIWEVHGEKSTFMTSKQMREILEKLSPRIGGKHPSHGRGSMKDHIDAMKKRFTDNRGKPRGKRPAQPNGKG